MSTDVRIDPEVTTVTVAGVTVRESALLLGGVPRGAAVIVLGPDGLRSLESVELMNSLAQHGYESVLAEPEDLGQEDDVARRVVQHLVDRMTARGWTHEQMGLLGYGQGARAVLVAAAETTFGAAVSLPRDPRQLLVPDRVVELRTPWLGMVGLGPQRRLSSELAVYRDEVAAASTEHVSLIGFSGVAHCLDDTSDARAHGVAFDAWQRTAEWLNTRVEPRPTPLAIAWRERQESVQTTAN